MSQSKILIYDSLTQLHVDISHKHSVNFYVCGPTTYSNCHLGHARNYIVHDTIRKILENYFQIPVTYVMNITDIDDKIVNRAFEEFGTSTLENCKKISDLYENEFFELMGKLGVARPTFLTRVTEYIPEMSEYVKVLLNKEYAYEKKGSYWFNSQKFKEDGLQNNPFGLRENHDRLQQKDLIQNNPDDFCLLKGKTNEEAHFETNLGKFRPGWHLECSTMVEHTLGKIDIHGGGIDLMFPHHTNEILQSCAYHGKSSWTDVFFHCGHLGIDGKKMSKSEKNFTTVYEILQYVPSQQLRMYFLKGNHCEPMEFSENELQGLSSFYTKVKTFSNIIKKYEKNIKQKKPSSDDLNIIEFFKVIRTNIDLHLRSNFNTCATLTELDSLIDKINEKELTLSPIIISDIHKYVMKIFEILGIVFENESSNLSDQMLHYLLSIRSEIRDLAKDKTIDKETKKKLFEITDKFRDVILPNLGIVLTDK